jgi:hypothetical protein
MDTGLLNPELFSDQIGLAAQRPRTAFRYSVLGHQEAFEELADVYNDCRNPGWDGYGAAAVEQETLRMAYTIIESLPLGFPRPSISAQPDGQLTLEWYHAPTRTLSISIDPDGFIHYGGLFGSEKHFGTVAYLDGLSERILRLATEVQPCSI